MRSQQLIRAVVPTMLLLASAALLLLRLGQPGEIVFDETYYVEDAQEYLRQGVEDGFAVHPPVGKWIIAAGIGLFGDDPIGWRVMGAVAGAVAVLLVYLIGIRLFRRVGPAALAALLLATDGMWFVQARTGMLDIILGFFVVLGAWLLLADHDRALAPERDPLPDVAAGDGWPVPAGGSIDHPPGAGSVDATTATLEPRGEDEGEGELLARQRRRLPHRGHLLRSLAGVAFGLAVATKWSGALALGTAIAVAIGWELARRHRLTGRRRTDLGRALASVTVGLVVLPVATYLVTYIPWLVNYEQTTTAEADCEVDGEVRDPCGVGLPARLAGLYRYHVGIAEFHLDLEVDHAYRAPAYTWPIMARPIVYYYESCSEERAAGRTTRNEDGEREAPPPCVVPQGVAAEIVAVGNPALWYAFLPATPLLVAGMVRRDRRAAFVTAFWAGQYLPWLLVARPAFFFYTVPFVPFLALGVAYAVTWLLERLPLKWLAVGALAGAGIGFAVGYAIEVATANAVDVARWLGLWAGSLIGAAAGSHLDRARQPALPRLRDTSPAGRWVGAAIAVLAVGLFVYFLPVWMGIALPEDAVRHRWWFRGWI